MKIFLLLISCFLLFSIDSLACACCAERGTYMLSTRKPSAFELEELAKIQLKTAEIYGGDPDAIKGIAPLGESFTASCLLKNNAFKFSFADNANKKGMLNLPLPATMVDYRVDLRDSEAADVNLYAEWRFKNKVVAGDGIFQKGIAPGTDYFLVLQGRGNMCIQAENFTHWRLEIRGKKASYAFFGNLK